MEKGARLEVRRRYGEPGLESGFTRVDDREYEKYCEGLGLKPGPESCTRGECLAIAAGRESPDGAFLFAGTGLPLIGCMFAQQTYAPNAVIVMESGIVGPRIEHLPISVSDPRAAYQCTTLSNMADVFGSVAMRGYCTAGILGGAECDKYGNLNSTAIGGYGSWQLSRAGKGKQIRLAGSGGANPIASFADFVIAMMAHERRRFPERCEYLTSPAGARGRPGSDEHRWRYGLYRGRHIVVLSTLGILRTDQGESGELLLDAIYPGVDEKSVYENTGWALRKSPTFHVMNPPTYEELKILRYIVDPTRIYLGRTKGDFARNGSAT
ncbi:MAG TPA: CoA-transferase [Pyrinomonadaceae bacterium]|jgi:glutaconate CoA-transferase subunit B